VVVGHLDVDLSEDETAEVSQGLLTMNLEGSAEEYKVLLEMQAGAVMAGPMDDGGKGPYMAQYYFSGPDGGPERMVSQR
jgi:hypothetical protein